MELTGSISAAIAREAKEEDLYFADCACYSLPRECMLFVPEDYPTRQKAVRAWAIHCIEQPTHWSVHWKRRHIIHVRNRFNVKALP